MTNTKDLQIVVKAKDEASTTLKRLGGEAETMAKSFGLGAISIGAVVASVGYLGKQMIDAAAKFEQTKIAFTTMTGSAEQANTILKNLAEMAARTPFELTQIETAAKQLMAYGIAARDVIPNLQVLGDVAATVGMDKLPNLIMAFGQVKAATKLTGMELRQFTEAGVPLIDQLAKHFKVSASEISDMVSKGKVGFKDVQAALADLTAEGGRAHGAMEEQSKTFLGRISTLKDNWDQFLRTQGNQLLVWGKMVVEKLIDIVEWLRADAEGLNYVGKMIYGVSQLFSALGQTVWAVSNVFGGLIRMLWEVGAVGVALVKDMIANFNNLGTRLKQIFGAIGQALKGNFKEAGDEMKAVFTSNLQNTVSQFGKMKEVGKDTMFGVGEAFKASGTAWSNFASLKGFETMKVKLGELPASIDGVGGGGKGGGEKNADKLKKQQEAFAKLGKEISDYATKASDDLKEVTKSIDETVKKMEELTSQNTQDNKGINNDMVSAYVAQEQKVTDLKKEVEQKKADITLKLNDQVDGDNIKSHNEELARMQSELSAKETLYNKEKTAFEQRRQIEVAFQQQVDEARKRASMTEFERTMNDLATKQLALNIEFDKKKTALESELKMNLDKAAVMKQIQEKAALEYKKSLALNEKSTVDSINNEIQHWNKLAEAMTRAKQGKTSNTISASSINQRLEQIGSQQKMQQPINITISGNTLLDNQAGEKIGNQLINLLGLNTKLAG